MIETLKYFADESTPLFNATKELLNKFNLSPISETEQALPAKDLFDEIPQNLNNALECIDRIYFPGLVNDLSLTGGTTNEKADEVIDNLKSSNKKYDAMFIFACEAKTGITLTRTTISVLTRAFNRLSGNPVILLIRQGKKLNLSTCERTNYSQEWRNGGGEKVGKVCILRDINCLNPHRGHIDILLTLGEKRYTSFDEMYKHWMEVFSSELLTRKFYNELSDWYAWAVQIVKFPNDLKTNSDDEIYNHEACIRLITRLIFVWFLKQKHLIPEEFFDERYIRENLIAEFDPHTKNSLLYNAENSKYYRLILQNLFFAMLNRPIVAEGKTNPNNRRFRTKESYHGMNKDYNINNLMRYESEFMEGGADKFLSLANSRVPFLNGGLFECLDDKPNKIYYDGFSEHKDSLSQLFFPDYLFFGDEVGREVNLSQWYEDARKKTVSVRGLVDILKRYSFTIEENTPFDQEVSLDPELLGKVFENLLASFNPETKQSARKQTGSFYTPREIVQYMVNESLVAHFKRMCGEANEQKYRDLLDYSTDNIDLNEEEREQIMDAIYNCRILDPACGSGAFPMGVLQQMVHILKRIDPSNKMWNEMMVDIAINDAKNEFQKVTAGNEVEKQRIEENRKARLNDIEDAFNENINYPDYARKLYLIEHCIYGVDIQPIATQISKLRFFISLVVDQKPSDDAKNNFGIRPLPNLESKFVTANTLIPMDRTKDIFSMSEDIRYYEEYLNDLQHRMFLAKRNSDKMRLKEDISATRRRMAQVMNNNNFIGITGLQQLTNWDMFDQNTSASFFDPEWMFGVKDGFDIVIGNPPYISTKGISATDKKLFEKAFGFSDDTYNLFTFKGISLLADQGSLNYIIPKTFWTTQTKRNMRNLILSNTLSYVFDTANPFEAVMVDTCIIQVVKKNSTNKSKVRFLDGSSDLLHPIEYPSVEQSLYTNTQNSVIFKPTRYNLEVWNKFGLKVKELYEKWWDKIETSKKITQNTKVLSSYREDLKPGEVTLLGCLTEGGQGLATANNGKYIAVRKSTKWASNIIESRPKKLSEAIAKKRIVIPAMQRFQNEQEYLASLSEKEIADLFDSLKEEYGRDIFGQGYIYKLIDDDEIADVNTLTQDEKENGIDISKNYYVPYDKGDKDGNRWYLETPFAIAWSKENVQFLKTDPKARYQGYLFYFREGFCWIDVNSTYLKARVKANGVFDVLSMSLFTMTSIPDWYFVLLINSRFISLYVDTFVNNTSHFQINDARQVPIVIPNTEQMAYAKTLFDNAYKIKTSTSKGLITPLEAEVELSKIEKQVDCFVLDLYSVKV